MATDSISRTSFSSESMSSGLRARLASLTEPGIFIASVYASSMSSGAGFRLDGGVAEEGRDVAAGFGSEIPRLLAQSSSLALAASYDSTERWARSEVASSGTKASSFKSAEATERSCDSLVDGNPSREAWPR